MDWITQNQAQEAAEQGELPALECSWEHHKQGRDATQDELIMAIISKDFGLGCRLCACCQLVGVMCYESKCKSCSLGQSFCLHNEVWQATNRPWEKLKNDLSNSNIKSFQQAEAELCTYIEGVIEKVKKEAEIKDKYDKEKCKKCEPKLRHGDYGYDSQGRRCLRLQVGNSNSGFTVASSEFVYGNDAGIAFVPKVILGNIFDDLKRNSENLGRTQINFEDGKDIFMDIAYKNKVWLHFSNTKTGGGGHLSMETATEFHQKLGQLIATAKRKQKC